MSFVNFLFSKFKAEDPLRKVANAKQQNRLANILNDITGEGCHIDKPTNAEGLGWRVVVPPYNDPEFNPPSLVKVAASDSLAAAKADADLICDGTADDIEIQSAIDSVSIGGRVYLYDGTYSITSRIIIQKNIALEGQTMAGAKIQPGGVLSGIKIAILANPNALSSAVKKLTIQEFALYDFEYGFYWQSGGGVCSLSNLTISDCTTRGVATASTTALGGGTLQMSKCTIDGNAVGLGTNHRGFLHCWKCSFSITLSERDLF